jgi:acyl-CoA thioesterase
MVNGHGILHGAVLFWLGDTAFAFLSESRGVASVSRQADIAYIAPVHAGARMTATATEKVRFGRNSIVDVDIFADEALVGRMTVHGAAVRSS